MRTTIILFFSSFLSLTLPAQSIRDSLYRQLANAPSDTAKATAMFRIGRFYARIPNGDSALYFGKMELAFAEKINYKRGIAQANSVIAMGYKYLNRSEDAIPYRKKALVLFEQLQDTMSIGYQLIALGSLYQDIAEYPQAEIYDKKALAIFTNISDKTWTTTPLLGLGAISFYRADYETSLGYYMKVLKISEQLGNEALIANACVNIGNVYNYQKSYDNAIAMYKRSLLLQRKLNKPYGIAACLINIGEMMAKSGKLDSALVNFTAGLNTSREINNVEMEALALYNIGSVLGEQKHYDQALDYYFRAKSKQEMIKNRVYVLQIMNDIGNIYLKQKKYPEALKIVNEAMAISKDIKAREHIQRGYQILSDIYAELGDHKKALELYKRSTNIKDSILNAASTKQIAEMSAKYETDKKDKEIELLNKDKTLQEIALDKQRAEAEKQQTQRNALIIGFALLATLSLFIFRGYRQKQKANNIIEAQKLLVEEKNKDITDSILYAKRIQEAILPAKEVKYKVFPDAFVLFEPRSIVSGDFYWFTEKNGSKLIAAVDCTGHGVPGAFMSMIGNAFLNEIVNEKGCTDPGEILQQLREKVISSLKQSEGSSESKDGMDIALLCFDASGRAVRFAGANNPLWVIRKNGAVEELRGDKQPIGVYETVQAPFKTHNIQVEKGDTLYIFTDGYADQFGGPSGKKFKYRKLQELLLTIQALSMAEQEKVLRKELSDWKGTQEQTDDILVIGIHA